MRIFRLILALSCLAAADLAPQAQEQIPEPADEFVVGMGNYGIELNPYKSIYAHEMQLFTALYEGLFSYDPQSLEPVRAQAESFTKSADGKTWTFRIRPDARWSDGSPVSAQDFVDSWLYLLAPATGAEYAVFFDIIQGARDYRTGRTRASSSVGISAQDARTLVVRLVSPASYFTRLLCHSSFVPVHPSLRGKRLWRAEEIIGNGPYTIATSDESAMSLVKNPGYWDAVNVAAGSIRVLFFETDEEATRRFNNGEVDWLTDRADIDSIASRESIQYAPMFATGYYFWNSTRKPWSDARVRRALALLVPWEKIRTEASYYAPTSVLVLPFAGYESPGGITSADEKEALRLLAEAGHPGGKGLPKVRFVSYASASHERNINIMEEAWKKIGLGVERIVVPDGATIRDIRQKGYTLSFTSWIGDFADPAAFLLMWTGDSGLNEAGYKNRDFDKLMASSMEEEGKTRFATLAKAEERLLSDAALLPLYHSISFNVIDTDRITGWFQNPLDIHPFKAIGFGAPKAAPYVAAGGGFGR